MNYFIINDNSIQANKWTEKMFLYNQESVTCKRVTYESINWCVMIDESIFEENKANIKPKWH